MAPRTYRVHTLYIRNAIRFGVNVACGGDALTFGLGGLKTHPTETSPLHFVLQMVETLCGNAENVRNEPRLTDAAGKANGRVAVVALTMIYRLRLASSR